MPGSVTSVFSEPGDFEAALREEGGLGLLITGRGQFRARLTQVKLHRLRLSATEEQLSRIAFVAVPADLILVSLPIDGRPAPIWGGIGMRTSEIMTLGPGQRVHARTDGPSRSGSIWLPVQDLARYGRALIGATFAVPSAARSLVVAPIWAVPMDIAPKHAGSASGMMNFGAALAGIISPFVFGYLVDLTGSWTLPFAGSICLLLLGAGLAFRMHPDRPFEPAVTAPVAA